MAGSREQKVLGLLALNIAYRQYIGRRLLISRSLEVDYWWILCMVKFLFL